jgi:hypothetical protein
MSEAGQLLDARTLYAGDTAFRPEVFFVGRTEGSGVVRDAFGRVMRRCEIVTVGTRVPGYSTIKFDETYAYDDGETDVWRWVMTHGRGDRYVAAEALAGPGITGHRVGDEFIVSFRRPVGPAKGVAAPSFRSRFTLLTPDIALKSVRVSVFGVPMGAMTAVHRRIS